MRKLIMWNVITLDGYFEGEKNWELSFHAMIWGKELEKISLEQLKEADYLVFGRITYEGMASYWKTEKGEIAELMNKLPKLVFSRTLISADWNNSQLIKSASEISKFKSEGTGHIYVFGSAKLSKIFIENNQFDEYRIGVSPVIAGKGRSLFYKSSIARPLVLVSTQQLSTGGVILTYKPEKYLT